MNMQTIILVSYLAIIVVLAFLKIRSFSNSSRKRAIRRWFYFNKSEIINAQNQKIRAARIKQNRLSLGLLILLLLSPILFLVLMPIIS